MKIKVYAKAGNCQCTSKSSSSSPSSNPCLCKPPPGNPNVPPPVSSTNSSDCPDPDEPATTTTEGPASSSASSSSSASVPGTNACTDPKSTDVTGKLIENKFIITHAPYELKRCDSVLIIEGATIPSLKNYAIKTMQLFTMSAYMINAFNSKDGKSLSQHLLLEDIPTIPSVIYGTLRCLTFNNKKGDPIIMCLDNEDQAKQIIDVFLELLKCRIGDNLKDVDPVDLQRVFKQACLGEKPPNDHGGDTGIISALLDPLLPKPPTKRTDNVVNFPYYNKRVAPGGNTS